MKYSIALIFIAAVMIIPGWNYPDAASRSGQFVHRLAELQRRGSCSELARFGVSTHQGRNSDDTNIRLVTDVGANIVRFDVFWNLVEMGGRFDFGRYDKLIEGLRSRGKMVLLILDYEHPDHSDGVTEDGARLPPRTTEQRNAFYRFVQMVVRRYHGPDVAYQIWNEPNMHWAPKPLAQEYGKLLAGAGKVIKDIAPNAIIVAGGIANEPNRDAYLNELITTQSLDHINALALHPYRPDGPENSLFDIAEFESVAARGRASLPLWLTEWGYSERWFAKTFSPNELPKRQAIMVSRLMLTAAIAKTKAAILYDLIDDGIDATNYEHHFGLYDYEFKPKKAAAAFRNLVMIMEKCDNYEFKFDGRKKLIFGAFANGERTFHVVWTYDTRRKQEICLDVGPYRIISLTNVYGENLVLQTCHDGSQAKLSIAESSGPLILRVDK